MRFGLVSRAKRGVTRTGFSLVAAREFAVVLGDGVLIAGRDSDRVGVTDRTALVFVELVAQLQFERVHGADQLLAHLLNQGGVPREASRVQIAHLFNQGLQLLLRLGTILHCGANLVEKVQPLVNLALRVGRVGTLIRRHGPTGDAGIAGVKIAIERAVAIPSTPGRTRDAVADRAGLAGAGLTRLWRSAGLTRLPVATELAGLGLATRLTLSRRGVGAAANASQFV